MTEILRFFSWPRGFPSIYGARAPSGHPGLPQKNASILLCPLLVSSILVFIEIEGLAVVKIGTKLLEDIDCKEQRVHR
jgi:hypothetical protein